MGGEGVGVVAVATLGIDFKNGWLVAKSTS